MDTLLRKDWKEEVTRNDKLHHICGPFERRPYHQDEWGTTDTFEYCVECGARFFYSLHQFSDRKEEQPTIWNKENYKG